MKLIRFLPGGAVRLDETDDRPMFPAAVEIRTLVSAVSSGTETGGLASMKDRTDGDWIPGYSLAGEVVSLGELAAERSGLSVGQQVAAYGAPYTFHASHVAAPWTLVHAVPEGVSLEEASFCGLAAISMHAIRRGNITPGERIVMIGGGILTMLADQMLRAWGCETMLVERHDERLAMAWKMGCRHLCDSRTQDPVAAARAFAPGGADAVLLFCNANGPAMNQAAEMSRDRGRLILVGGGDVGVAWSQIFRKELDLLVSRAGGPGRYDAQYEKQGRDIPPAWMRWTEGRNVAEYLAMAAAGQINVRDLMTHRFAADQAADAYALLTGPGRYDAMGVVFEWK